MIMSFIFTSFLQPSSPPRQEPRDQVQVQLCDKPCSPEEIVKNLVSIEGPIDVITWLEGTQGLPPSGAAFMGECIFKPLRKLKENAKLYVYSLKGWDFNKKNITALATSTPLGEAINRINKAIECIYSSSFFRYCTRFSKESELYAFINAELPKKKWLFDLSSSQKKTGMTVAELFDNQTSCFDCINNLDVSAAYSLMQYIEGYYLIHESVKKGLEKGLKKIEIAFVLPNDEGKYYLDLPKDIRKMLLLDFGKALREVDINISLHLFEYGESAKSRPYIDKNPKAAKVKADEIRGYFDYLSQESLTCGKPQMSRDVIHKFNEYV
jgi:hypothetical protein